MISQAWVDLTDTQRKGLGIADDATPEEASNSQPPRLSDEDQLYADVYSEARGEFPPLAANGSPELVDAWRSVLGFADELEVVAGVRIALSDVLDLPPALESRNGFSRGPSTRRYGACFSPLAPAWRRPGEQVTDRWLRLSSAAEPVRLLTVEETVEAAERTARPIRPLVAVTDDGDRMRINA